MDATWMLIFVKIDEALQRDSIAEASTTDKSSLNVLSVPSIKVISD